MTGGVSRMTTSRKPRALGQHIVMIPAFFRLPLGNRMTSERASHDDLVHQPVFQDHHGVMVDC